MDVVLLALRRGFRFQRGKEYVNHVQGLITVNKYKKGLRRAFSNTCNADA